MVGGVTFPWIVLNGRITLILATEAVWRPFLTAKSQPQWLSVSVFPLVLRSVGLKTRMLIAIAIAERF